MDFSLTHANVLDVLETFVSNGQYAAALMVLNETKENVPMTKGPNPAMVELCNALANGAEQRLILKMLADLR